MPSQSIQFAPPAARDWDFPRSISGVGLLVDAVHHHRGSAVPTGEVLRGTGLGAGDLGVADREVTAAQELQVVRNVARMLSDIPDAGLQVGATYHLSTFGIFGYALLSSPTVLDAMNLALRFIDLSFTFAIPSAVLEDGRPRIVVSDHGLPEDVRRFLVERDLAAIHTVLDELLPGGVPLLDAELAFPPPADATPWRAVLGVAPRFGAARHSLGVDPAYLGKRLPQGNPTTVALCESLCTDVVSRRRLRTGVTQQVRVILTQRVAFGVGMEDVAAALGVSVRTLRRRLAEEGTAFQQLLDEVRQSLAEEMLATGVLRVEDIALRLGYAEASSFIHAFKRWTGTLPTQSAATRSSRR